MISKYIVISRNLLKYHIYEVFLNIINHLVIRHQFFIFYLILIIFYWITNRESLKAWNSWIVMDSTIKFLDLYWVPHILLYYLYKEMIVYMIFPCDLPMMWQKGFLHLLNFLSMIYQNKFAIILKVGLLGWIHLRIMKLMCDHLS